MRLGRGFVLGGTENRRHTAKFFPNELFTEGNNFSKTATFVQKQRSPDWEYLGVIIFEKNP